MGVCNIRSAHNEFHDWRKPATAYQNCHLIQTKYEVSFRPKMEIVVTARCAGSKLHLLMLY